MKRSTMWKMSLVAALLAPFAAWSAVPLIPSTSQYSEPSQIVGTLNFLVNTINTAITPQTMAAYSNSRNVVDNGAMQVQQRGTGTRTCAANAAITTAAYAADRWGCSVNVASGAGTLQVITTNLPAAPLPPFAAAQVFYRTSGALAQPQCVMQEIPTYKATQLAGQNINLSFYAQGLTNMLAEQTTLNAYVFYGTGTDEGFGTMTASPAITPAWTGINSSLTTAFTITSSWARYSTSFLLPSTATEAGVALCWTPTVGGTAGTTDGFRFTGVQLEQGSSASPYEFRSPAAELLEAERYFYAINEGTITAGTVMVGGGSAQGTTTTCTTAIPFPVTMWKAPTYTNALTASTFKLVSASQTATALSTPFSATLGANTPYGASINFTTTGMTAKDGCFLVSAAGSGTMQFTADF
jgi:hypothetical protein